VPPLLCCHRYFATAACLRRRRRHRRHHCHRHCRRRRHTGLFCGQAGLSFMAGLNVDGVHDWGKFTTPQAALLAAPGAAAGVAT
jgi:hypothetical protein